MRHGCTPDMELVASRDAPTWAALGRAPQWQMQKVARPRQCIPKARVLGAFARYMTSWCGEVW